MKGHVCSINIGVKMPIARAVDRVLVVDKRTGKRKLVRVKKRVVDQWGQYDFPMSAARAEQILRRFGVIDKHGMIVIEY